MATNNLLVELNYPQHNVPLYEDHEACIRIALQESSKHKKTKHVENKIRYIRDLIQKKIVDIIKINTQIQLADIIFTKALGREVFLRHRDVLLGIPPSGPLQEFLEKTKRLYHDKRT